MTFAEIVLSLLLAAGLYFLLRPLQAGLESLFLRWLDPRRRRVIDVSSKKAERPSQKE